MPTPFFPPPPIQQEQNDETTVNTFILPEPPIDLIFDDFITAANSSDLTTAGDIIRHINDNISTISSYKPSFLKKDEILNSLNIIIANSSDLTTAGDIISFINNLLSNGIITSINFSSMKKIFLEIFDRCANENVDLTTAGDIISSFINLYSKGHFVYNDLIPMKKNVFEDI